MQFALTTLVGCLCISYGAAQLGGSISPNLAGGTDANIAAVQRIGTDNHNGVVGLFAAGNSLKPGATTGGFANYNINGHGVGVEHTKVPGFGSTFSQNAHANVLNSGAHKVDLNAFHGKTALENGFKFNNFGGGVGYNHAAGHAASLSASHIPQLQRSSVDLMGKANLWNSRDRRTSLDLTGTASRVFTPMGASNNFATGLGLRHTFG